MKLKKYVSLFLALALLSLVLAGCGGSAKNAMAYSAADMTMTAPATPAAGAPMENYAMEEAAMDMEAGKVLNSGNTAGSTALPESRKWIITVDMQAETDDLDTMTAALDQKIQAMNGYVEDQNIHNGSTYSSRRYRSAYMTIRIPAEDVDSFTDEVAGIANVVSKSKNLEDITLRYVSTENRVKALETEEERLLELLAQAENMTDLLEIEGRLTDVRYELENHASQLRLYDNQVDYATIYLNIEEVKEYTPVEDPTLWERIRDGFKDSLEGLWESLQDLLVWLIVSLPFILVYGTILVLVLWLTRGLRAKLKARKAERKQRKKSSE